MEVWIVLFVTGIVVSFIFGFVIGGFTVEYLIKCDAAGNGVGEWYIHPQSYKVHWRWKKNS